MRIGAWVLGLLVLGAGAAGAQDCHLRQYASIGFTAAPHGVILPVKFGDADKQLGFNLSSASNALTADAVHELGLHQSTIPSHSHVSRNGVPVYYSARAPHIVIDTDGFDNVDFLMLPPGMHNGSLAGEIGTRQFEKADIELDMAANKLNLFDMGHCPGKAVYWTSTGFAKLPLEIDGHDYIRVRMMLDGKPLLLALSTEGQSTIGMNAMRRSFGLDASSPGMTLDHVSAAGVKFYRYEFQKLETEGLAINHPAIMIRDEPDGPGCVSGQHPFTTGGPATGGLQTNLLEETHCYGMADGNLGLSVLSRLHLYISKNEKLLYLTGAGAK